MPRVRVLDDRLDDNGAWRTLRPCGPCEEARRQGVALHGVEQQLMLGLLRAVVRSPAYRESLTRLESRDPSDVWYDGSARLWVLTYEGTPDASDADTVEVAVVFGVAEHPENLAVVAAVELSRTSEGDVWERLLAVVQ